MSQLQPDDAVLEYFRAYIDDQTFTFEKSSDDDVCIIAGPEYGDLEHSLIVISKARLGLRKSQLHWNGAFSRALTAEGFVPSNAAPDNWTRKNGETHEHINVYVDDVVAIEGLETPQDTTSDVNWDDIADEPGGLELLVTHFHNGPRPRT
jgi:hypothetical protein